MKKIRSFLYFHHYTRYVSPVRWHEKKEREKRREGGGKKSNSSASGECVIGELGENWFVLHAKRGMEKEMDSIRWKKDPSKPSRLRPSSPFCSFSSDDEGYLTYRVVVGKSRVTLRSSSVRASSLREPNAKRKKTR